MGKSLYPLLKKDNNYQQLAANNCNAIKDYNEKMLSALTLTGALLMTLPALAAPLSKTKTENIPVYILASIFFSSCSLDSSFLILNRTSFQDCI